jgi:hypothetical protein
MVVVLGGIVGTIVVAHVPPARCDDQLAAEQRLSRCLTGLSRGVSSDA